MLKSKFICIFFLLSLNAGFFYAQNGYVYYKKLLSSVDYTEQNELVQDALNKVERLEYQLAFNESKAKYEELESMSVDSNPVVETMTRAFADFDGKVYYDIKKNIFIHKIEFAGGTFLVEKDKVEWKLTKDTLRIDKYLCYKAIANRTILNSTGTHNLTITAWYAPEIPLPYGPDGYGGLPGLILQIENNGVLTVAKKLDFLRGKSLIIDIPSKGKKITEKEFNELALRKFETRKDH